MGHTYSFPRRDFLLAGGTAALCSPWAFAADAPKDVRITRVTSLNMTHTRPKFVGKNGARGDHGTQGGDDVLIVETNAGVTGVGQCWARSNPCAELLGKNPFDFFKSDEKRFTSPIGGAQTAPLWDLVGKLLDKPVFQLLGGDKPKPVDAYDGTIYLLDLIPEYRDRWQDQLRKELDMSLDRGHRMFKVKIGRGKNWMLKAEGYERDVAFLKVIRKHVGPKVRIGVDANTTYGMEQTKRLLTELADYDFAFVEEMFPDDIEQFLQLKGWMKEQGLKALLADGESHWRADMIKPWVAAKAVDIYQGDMNALGFRGVLDCAEMAKPIGGYVAPHNWGSLFGYYSQLQVGCAIDNFYAAEQDFMTNPAVSAEGYSLKDGKATVPAVPGLGIDVDMSKLEGNAKLHFTYKA